MAVSTPLSPPRISGSERFSGECPGAIRSKPGLKRVLLTSDGRASSHRRHARGERLWYKKKNLRALLPQFREPDAWISASVRPVRRLSWKMMPSIAPSAGPP